MAIDRCFTLEGSGTVVTGTVASGAVNQEDTVTLISDNTHSGKSGRVRSLHTQSAKAEQSRFGQRCALNLSGEVARLKPGRGDWVVGNKDFKATRQLDVIIESVAYTADKQSPVNTSNCLLYTSPSPRDATLSRMPSSA